MYSKSTNQVLSKHEVLVQEFDKAQRVKLNSLTMSDIPFLNETSQRWYIIPTNPFLVNNCLDRDHLMGSTYELWFIFLVRVSQVTALFSTQCKIVYRHRRHKNLQVHTHMLCTKHNYSKHMAGMTLRISDRWSVYSKKQPADWCSIRSKSQIRLVKILPST